MGRLRLKSVCVFLCLSVFVCLIYSAGVYLCFCCLSYESLLAIMMFVICYKHEYPKVHNENVSLCFTADTEFLFTCYLLNISDSQNC